MLDLQALVPALGVDAQQSHHGIWPFLLLLVVFVLIAPVAYYFGHGGGRPDDGPPLRP